MAFHLELYVVLEAFPYIFGYVLELIVVGSHIDIKFLLRDKSYSQAVPSLDFQKL